MKVTLSDEGLITFEDGDSLNRNTLNRKRLVAVPETALAAGESLWVQFGDNIDYDAAASEILEPIMLEYAEEYGGYITLLPDAVLRKPGKWYMTLAVRLYAADGTTYQSQLTSEKTSFTVNDSYPLEDGGYASNATLQNLYNETVAAKEAASASATAAQGYMEQAKEYAQKEYKLYDSFADLPEPGDSAFIYLVPQQGSEERDNYAEYLWISESGAYEFIGTVNDIDLSNYAQQNGTYPDMTVGNATNATNASHATSADSATSATNATNATHAETADKVANALTMQNAYYSENNGQNYISGSFAYDGSVARTVDLAPQTTNVYAEITAANMFAYVYAHIVMQRWGNKANIHMDFRIDLRSGNPISEWTLFTTARLADVLGLSSLSFESNNTRVMIENCPSGTFGTVGGVYAGYTGFVLAFDSTYSGGIGIGRIYNQPSNDGVGGWEVTEEEVYNEDYIYHADIWGADVT